MSNTILLLQKFIQFTDFFLNIEIMSIPIRNYLFFIIILGLIIYILKTIFNTK